MKKDPYNIIITGVGGQGNVLAARILGNTLVAQGFNVTIGETFGASQRGGSVMSHLRVSKTSSWSPQIPKGKAHLVIALEPIESLRVMAQYGSKDTAVISNSRPIYPVSVICGDSAYPSVEELRESLSQIASDVRFINATDEAVRLGHSILSNVIMVGAAAALDDIQINEEAFRAVMSSSLSKDKVEINMEAFRAGKKMCAAMCK